MSNVSLKNLATLLSIIMLQVLILPSKSNAGSFSPKGPVAQKDKTILFISQDYKNGGISTLFRHFQIATSHLDWQLNHIDGGNDLGEIIENNWVNIS